MIQIGPLFNYNGADYYVVYAVDKDNMLIHADINAANNSIGVPYRFQINNGEIGQVVDPTSYADYRKTDALNSFLRTHIPRKEYAD